MNRGGSRIERLRREKDRRRRLRSEAFNVSLVSFQQACVTRFEAT